MTKFEGIQNSNVSVIYQHKPEAVFVYNNRIAGKLEGMYAGIGGLKEMFRAFTDSFSDDTDAAAAMQFFKSEFKIN